MNKNLVKNSLKDSNWSRNTTIVRAPANYVKVLTFILFEPSNSKKFISLKKDLKINTWLSQFDIKCTSIRSLYGLIFDEQRRLGKLIQLLLAFYSRCDLLLEHLYRIHHFVNENEQFDAKTWYMKRFVSSIIWRKQVVNNNLKFWPWTTLTVHRFKACFLHQYQLLASFVIKGFNIMV